MQVISSDAELAMLSKIEQLRKQASGWYVVEICITGITAPHATRQVITGIIMQVMQGQEAALYFCHEDYIFIVAQNAPLGLVSDIYREIGLLFLGKALTWQKEGRKESSICRTHRTHEALEYLFINILNLAAGPHSPAHEVATQEDKLNIALFQHACQLRYLRDKLCIIVVEDERSLQRLLASMLGRQYEIIYADDGTQALRLYETTAPDIVFLDINLPKISGLEVLAQITENDKDAFVALLTGSGALDDVQTAQSRHAKQYIVKPFRRSRIDVVMQQYFKQFPHRAMKI